jgi:cobalt-zinc-cadmium efflux system outer membrane protein
MATTRSSAGPLLQSLLSGCLLSVVLAGCESTTAGQPLRRSPPLAALAPAPPRTAPTAHPAPSANGIQQTTYSTMGEGEGIVQASGQAEGRSVPPVLPPPTSVAGSPQAPVAEEAVALTLPQALNRSLLANPDLVALRGQLPVNQAMVKVARTYPWNPFVQAQYFPRGHPFVPNAPGEPASGAGMSNYYVWVMQRFELAHQRQHRIDGALAALDQTQWNIMQGELLNVAQTTRLYLTTVYQKDLRQLAVETAELNERLADITERRFKANLARAADVTTAKVAARQSRRQAELSEATYRAALLALRQQLNLPLSEPVTLTETLSDIQWLPLTPDGPPADESQLAAGLVEGRPDVLAAQAGVSVAEANWRLARAAIIPDIQAGPIYETADDSTKYLGLRLQMDIPVWNNGIPLTRQRRAERDRQELTAVQLKVRATLEAQTAIDQYNRVRAMVEKTPAMGQEAVTRELRDITRLFEAGQADVLAVLTTQTNLLQERRVYLDLVNQLAQTAANLIQATGLPPERIIRLPGGACAADACPPPATPEHPLP